MAGQVIVAAGTYGTLRLLLRMRGTGRLPRRSRPLGGLRQDRGRQSRTARQAGQSPALVPTHDHRAGNAASRQVDHGDRGPLGWRLRARPGYGEPNPTWIPQGHEVARALVDEIGGMAAGSWLDLFDIPATVHLIGG
ncbi:MAG: hypothetical protein ACYCVZ_05320 [Streptosporangiaceae bacterium]